VALILISMLKVVVVMEARLRKVMTKVNLV
jgi:hypothetical protein